MNIKEYISTYMDKVNDLITDININDIYTIIGHVLKLDKTTLFIKLTDYILTVNEISNITDKLDDYYINNIPIQYIVGKCNFFNEEYIVNSNVLIPRADTEILVEKAIEYIKLYDLTTCIDMCTGSGAVGISIAKNSNIENVILCDISSKALDVTKQNIVLNNIENKCNCIQTDLFSNLDTKVDIIVSNPPYIKSSVIPTLSKHVQNEPMLALDGGISGLDIYNKIIKEAYKYLNNIGYLLLEIGYDQKDELKNVVDTVNTIYATNNIKVHIEYVDCLKDFGGNDRVVVCKYIIISD